MLASDVEFIDIDPYQWGKLKEIAVLTVNKYITAYVLYNEAKIINIQVENSSNYQGALGDDYNPLLQPHEIAEEIFLKRPDVTRVETYELTALKSYGIKISFNSDEMESDVYFSYCRQLKNNFPGFNTFLKNPSVPKLDILDFLCFLERNNPQNYYLGIGIYHENSLYFSLILGILKGKIKLISTFEYLQKFSIAPPSFDEYDTFTPKFQKILKQEGEVIFLQLDLLANLSISPDKDLVLQEAIHDRQARYNESRFGLFRKFLDNSY